MADRRSAKTLAIIKEQDLAKTRDSGITTLQTELSHSGISDGVIKLQQQLSEQFGIVTFDIDGNISTIPITRELDPTINTGTGKYTSEAFYDSVKTIKSTLDTPQGVSWFDDYIAQPIREYVAQLFAPVNYDELTPDVREKVEELDKRLDELKASHTKLQLTGKSSQYYLNPIEKEIQQVMNQKTALLNNFLAQTRVTDEIKALTAELHGLIEEPYVTAKLKATITDELTQGSSILQNIIEKGLNVEQSLLNELRTSMKELQFRLQEPIQEPKTDLEFNLPKLGEQILGNVQNNIEGFASLFNPSVEELVNRARNQIESQKTLLRLLGAVEASK